VSSSDWPRGCEALICGSRSTVSVDRATTGLGWAGYEPGWASLGQAGLDTCQLLSVPRRTARLLSG
jgi:hypothetical protein